MPPLLLRAPEERNVWLVRQFTIDFTLTRARINKDGCYYKHLAPLERGQFLKVALVP